MKNCLLFAVFCLGLFSLGCASTPTNDNTVETHDFPHLTWSDVASSVEAGAVLVDSRGPKSYAKGHIDGAISIPWRNQDAYSQLPGDKTTALVFYCGGPQCSASTRGCAEAKKRGYTNISEFKGGYPEWSKLQAPATP